MKNVVGLFMDAAARVPTVPALVSAHEGSISFAELRSRVEGCAAGLARAGLGSGDRVVFMMPMSIDLYVAVLGALAVGGVATFVDPWVPIREIARLAAAARPAAFIGSPRAHVLRWMSRELRGVPITVVSGGPVGRLFARYRLMALRGAAASAVDVPAAATALITYTTGSSGRAKGVNRTHAILAAQHAVIREEFPAAPGDVDVTTFPVFALSNLAAGITTVIPRVNLRRVAEADSRLIVEDIERFGVTTAAASPPFFDAMARHGAGGRTMPRLRRIVTGGAPVRDDQLRAWRAAWPETEIVVAFGSSEAEPVASITAEERLEVAGTRPGFCVGKPVRSIRARTVPITRQPITRLDEPGAGSIGELLVSGPHVCRDYAGDAEAFAENKVRDGIDVWHRMGDTGYFDDEGRFWLVGRVHSTIRRGGVDLHANLIEATARGEDTRIRRVAALGMPDADLGERLVIVVESAHAVGTDVRARLAAARVDVMVDELLVTGKSLPVDPRHNSKVDYVRLRALVQSGEVA